MTSEAKDYYLRISECLEQYQKVKREKLALIQRESLEIFPGIEDKGTNFTSQPVVHNNPKYLSKLNSPVQNDRQDQPMIVKTRNIHSITDLSAISDHNFHKSPIRLSKEKVKFLPSEAKAHSIDNNLILPTITSIDISKINTFNSSLESSPTLESLDNEKVKIQEIVQNSSREQEMRYIFSPLGIVSMSDVPPTHSTISSVLQLNDGIVYINIYIFIYIYIEDSSSAIQKLNTKFKKINKTRQMKILSNLKRMRLNHNKYSHNVPLNKFIKHSASVRNISPKIPLLIEYSAGNTYKSDLASKEIYPKINLENMAYINTDSMLKDVNLSVSKKNMSNPISMSENTNNCSLHRTPCKIYTE